MGINFENLGSMLSIGGFFVLHIHSLICLSYQEEISSLKYSGFTDGKESILQEVLALLRKSFLTSS